MKIKEFREMLKQLDETGMIDENTEVLIEAGDMLDDVRDVYLKISRNALIISDFNG